eukprot:7470006-Pyramimonas_sp.AAC.1
MPICWRSDARDDAAVSPGPCACPIAARSRCANNLRANVIEDAPRDAAAELLRIARRGARIARSSGT